MKRLISFLLLAFCFLAMQAQSLAVQSFRMDESDLTANTPGTIVMDQNGQKCALIKVETTQTGFSFDAGSLGVVKTEQKVGEIWVYVPEGVKRLTISHQQLGMLRDYDLGQTLKRAKTYILKLVSGEVQTTVKQSRTSQYVVFQLQPANAVVMLNGEMLSTADGTAMKMMKFGTYDYQVQAPDYLPEVGKVAVNDPKNKHVVNVQLKPNFAQVTLTVDNNAEIWVNGERKGEGSWTGNLGAGTYELETRLLNHRPQSVTRDIVVSAQPQTIHLQAPIPIYGEADISSTPAMADIYIDGTKHGQTPQVVEQLLIGEHQLRLSKQGFADYNSTITVREGETASVTATLTKESAEVQTAAPTTVVTAANQNRIVTVGNVSFTMIFVEGGTFMMGATKEQENPGDDEKPVHLVTLSPYYIGETEVTQELWEVVMGNNPSEFKGALRPVEQVSWNDCQEFIYKLNQLTGLEFNLPSEAQWEFAARGGNLGHGYQYSGSYKFNDYYSRTHNVKKKKPNELGIYDMSGNVWEWCHDLYGSYIRDSQTNPFGPSVGSGRVNRGGSWGNSTDCRVAIRGSNTPGYRSSNLGLRLALQ